MTQARLRVEPADALVDVPRSIQLQGFAPAAAVTLRAALDHPDGSRWESEATFTADAAGEVDVGLLAPLSGDWAQADATAPVWALRRVSPVRWPEHSEGIVSLNVA